MTDILVVDNDNENVEDKPVAPRAGVVYGDMIYWITVVATVVVIIGSIVTIVTTNNYIDPNYLLSAIWQGKNVEDIWVGAVGAQPDGHWYLSHLFTGNGLTTAGIALGVFSVIPGIIAAAYVLFKEKERLYGSLAVLAAIITLAAVVG